MFVFLSSKFLEVAKNYRVNIYKDGEDIKENGWRNDGALKPNRLTHLPFHHFSNRQIPFPKFNQLSN